MKSTTRGDTLHNRGDGPTDQRGGRTDLQRSFFGTTNFQSLKCWAIYVPDCILLSNTAALRSEVLRRTCFFHNLELLFRFFLLRGYMHWQTPWIGFGGYGSFSWASFSPWVHECWAAHLPHTIHPKKGLPSDTQRAWAFSWWNLHPFSIALTHGQRPWQSIHSGLCAVFFLAPSSSMMFPSMDYMCGLVPNSK
jgi:hypothetical protein